MDSKYVRGQFARVAGVAQDMEITGFKATANDVLYSLRDNAGVEMKDVSQENITGLNRYNSESWTGEQRKNSTLANLKKKLRIG